jgi:hypothetical protein
MTDQPNAPQDRTTSFPGLAALGCIVAGAAALITGFIAALDKSDFAGAGLCLLASACAFGFLANALFRK